jgi:NDP-sugar pyrophosphorylase family protein
VGRGTVDPSASLEKAEISKPVRIEAGVKVRGGRIGPNVTLEEGAVANDCELQDTVVGPKSVLERARLHDSIIGAHVQITDVAGTLLVTDHSVVTGKAPK